MTKEEVAGIVAYCEEKKISYKQRLDDLWIPTWKFYDSKRKFAPKQDGDNAGESHQLLSGETFLANPIKPSQWMEDVLLRIPKREDNRAALSELLPDKWAKQTN